MTKAPSRVTRPELREHIRSLWSGLHEYANVAAAWEAVHYRRKRLERTLRLAREAEAEVGREDPTRAGAAVTLGWWHARDLRTLPAEIEQLTREEVKLRRQMRALERGRTVGSVGDRRATALVATRALLAEQVRLTASDTEPPLVRCVADMTYAQRDAELARQLRRLHRWEGLLPAERDEGAVTDAEVCLSLPVACEEGQVGQGALW